MSKKQWMVLLMLFLTYLLFGASIFYHIESRLEIDKVAQARRERIEINALLNEHYMPKDAREQHEILERLTRYCGKSVYNYTEHETDPLKWDFYNSFYFAYTVVSTIGYGNLAPTNILSRILMIFYAVIGIPMNGILLAQLGEFFGLVFVRAHKKYKSYKQHSQTECSKKHTPLETRKAGLAAQIFMYLIPGFVMFIFFPAFLFSHYEGWSYEEAVYYAFVTLTTIGFGDYVAGQDNAKGSGVFFILYKSFLIAWISFGLGYIVMIMTFIATGMRSKKIIRLEHKLAMNLKHTQSKIWNEFNKEVGYLRRVFNELQLSKVKPIYVDEYDYEAPPPKFQRSNSLPDLRDLVYGGLANPPPPHPRRRANSEVVPVESPVARVVSETDLQRIDKNATFATHAMVQPAELLARLVNILGYIPSPPDGENDGGDGEQAADLDSPKSGVQGFTDKEILASEGWNNSMWKLGGDSKGATLRRPRSRAASEVRLGPKYDPSATQRNVEWTWSGPSASRKIQEIMKARRNGVNAGGNNASASGNETKSKFPNLPISVPKALLPRWIKQLSNRRENNATRTRNSISAGDLDERGNENYLTQPSGGLNMKRGLSRHYGEAYDPEDSSYRPYFTHTGAANLASSLEGSNLLEETSLADFLRALTALHTRVAGALPDEYVKKPQRKMGTASLTPPKLPSLFTLFSPPHGASMAHQNDQNTGNGAATDLAGRRFSLRAAENSGNSTPLYNRRSSLAHPSAKPRRRFSLRPVVTPVGNSPQSGSPYPSGMQSKDPQDATTPSPPTYNAEGFIFECPKEPLVPMEGAPGVSTPITTSTGVRRFSLRPAVQADSSQLPQTPANIGKGLPRWRAGMLQRQINQINLRKRARAFSLSDVNTEGIRAVGERSATQAVSPLVDGVKIVGGPKDQSSKTGQKTVTIVSPRPEELAALRSDESSQKSMVKTGESDFSNSPIVPGDKRSCKRSIPMVRAFSTINNPFAFVDNTVPAIAKNPFVVEATRDRRDDFEDSSKSRTVYQALQNVRNIEAGPSTSQRDSMYKETSNVGLDQEAESEKTLVPSGSNDSLKKQSFSSCSTATTDTKSTSRRVSPVSVEAWHESRKNDCRKVSNISQESNAESLANSSRKSSTNKNPNEKPRVSIDSYKPLLEVKIEKPSENPFERYRATMQMSSCDNDGLVEIKIDSQSSDDEKKTSKKSNAHLRESET